MFHRTSKRDKLAAIEERRFVVLLGILTIFIAYRSELPKDFPYPLPYFPHLQIILLPLFDRFVLVFGIYAVFMLVYFSEPLYHLWTREIFRRAAWMTLMAYWSNFFYIASGLLVSIFVPNWLILSYLIAFGLGLALIWVSLWEYLSGRKRWIRRAVSGALPALIKVWSKMRSFVKSLKYVRTWLFSYRHMRVKCVTGSLFIVNSILIPSFIGLSWEATQTLDNLRVDCAPYLSSDPSYENRTLPLQFNRFNASILLDNPTILPLHLFWSLSLNFNASSVPDSG